MIVSKQSHFVLSRATKSWCRLGFCFTPFQRLWLYNGAPLVAFYDTLGIQRTYSQLKPPASSRGTWCMWPTEFSGITPQDDVIDRLIASCTARTSNVVPNDIIDQVMQVADRLLGSRQTATSLTELCRCATDFLKSHPINFLKSQYKRH